MSTLLIVQITLYGCCLVVGLVGNTATIVVLHWLKALANTFDAVTVTLVVHLCISGLILCLTALPFRIWNVVVGGAWPFNQAPTCWFYAMPLVTTNVSGLLMLSLAVTRFLAVFFPIKYRFLLRVSAVRLALISIPWILPYAEHILFAIAGGYKSAIDTSTGGLCVFLPTSPNLIDLYKLFSMWVMVVNVIAPLCLGSVLYGAIGMRLHLRERMRRRQINPQLVKCTAITVFTTTTLDHQRSEHSIRALALAFAVTMMCLTLRPLTFAFILSTRPIVLLLVYEVLMFSSASVGPLVYLLTMPEMRSEYWRLLRASVRQVYNYIRACCNKGGRSQQAVNNDEIT